MLQKVPLQRGGLNCTLFFNKPIIVSVVRSLFLKGMSSLSLLRIRGFKKQVLISEGNSFSFFFFWFSALFYIYWLLSDNKYLTRTSSRFLCRVCRVFTNQIWVSSWKSRNHSTKEERGGLRFSSFLLSRMYVCGVVKQTTVSLQRKYSVFSRRAGTSAVSNTCIRMSGVVTITCI